MNASIVADALALAGYAVAIVVCATGRRHTIRRDVGLALGALLGVSVLLEAIDFVEAYTATEALDPLEDLLRALQPLAWGGLLYAFEQSRVREVLERREARFREFTDIAADWVWEMGPDLRFTYMSERIRDIAGIEPGDLVGRRREEVGVFPGDEELHAAHLRDLEAHRPFREFRYRRVRDDGSVQWFETSGKPLFAENGRFLGYRGTAREVTREMEALGALRDSEERFRNLIEGSIQGIYVHRDYVPQFANRALADMLGYEGPEDILALPSVEAFIDPSEHDRMRGFREARERGDPAPTLYEFVAVRKDGARIRLLNSARRVTWGGEPAVQSVVVDVTEHRRAEAQLRAEMAFVDAAIDSLPGVFFLLDHEGHILRWNRNAERVTGYPGERIARMAPPELFEPAHRARVAEAIATVRERGHATVEANALLADGSRRPFFFSARVFSRDGQPCIVGTGIDLGELRELESALAISEQRYRALYDDNPSMYLTIGRVGEILSVNRHGAEQLGYTVEELVGSPAERLYPPDERATFRAELDACVEAGGDVRRWELRKVRRDGSTMWVRETARVVEAGDGEPMVLVVAEDVSEAHDLSEQLAYEATHDGLTDLINRREFEDRLERVLQTAADEGSEHALCYLDLDQFKVVNDTCGHMAGDELLRQLGAVLKSCIRKRDTLARLGGDEFAVLMEHCPPRQAERIAQSLRRAVEEFRFLWEDYSFKVGVSIGVVPIAGAAASAAHALGMADNACYVAKEQDRNRVHVYGADDAEVARRAGEMQWVARLDAALESDRFSLVRQPIVPLSERSGGDHYELLLRMEGEDGALISPGAFLTAAERYNVAVRLDRWVVDRALDWLIQSPGELERLFLCNINLSGQSLADESFLLHVMRRFAETGVPPEKICFEITESAAIGNFSGAYEFISKLRRLGCPFALDDFGSGLSSFGYLKTLPVDYVKIDGLFVKDIVDDPIDYSMVSAINEIGHVMGKETIAEFVESEAILDRLRAMGVDYAQGYHVGRPEAFPRAEEVGGASRRRV